VRDIDDSNISSGIGKDLWVAILGLLNDEVPLAIAEHGSDLIHKIKAFFTPKG
jgi:hypothetical protein